MAEGLCTAFESLIDSGLTLLSVGVVALRLCVRLRLAFWSLTHPFSNVPTCATWLLPSPSGGRALQAPC